MSTLSSHVDIREVSLRDGLQIEAANPVVRPSLNCWRPLSPPGYARSRPPLSSPRPRCPRWPTPPNWRPSCTGLTASSSPRLVASPNGAKRALAAGLRSIEYVVSAVRRAQPRQRRAVQAEAIAQIGDIVAIAHDSAASVEVIVACAWDCPFDGPTPPQQVFESSSGPRSRRRSARDRRHHRHHHPAPHDRPVRRPAGRRPTTSRWVPISTTPAAPAWPARTPP